MPSDTYCGLLECSFFLRPVEQRQVLFQGVLRMRLVYLIEFVSFVEEFFFFFKLEAL